MKITRQTEILSIIRTAEVETQEQLLEQLSARGLTATQATISRDIKELQLIKELVNGRYRYAVPERRGDGSTASRVRNIFKEGVLSMNVAQNIVVLRTMPGMASAACFALDNITMPGMVGSLAGDDTAIIIMKDNESANAFDGQVHQLLG